MEPIVTGVLAGILASGIVMAAGASGLGPAGPAGPMGPAGIVGPTGPTGAAGGSGGGGGGGGGESASPPDSVIWQPGGSSPPATGFVTGDAAVLNTYLSSNAQVTVVRIDDSLASGAVIVDSPIDGGNRVQFEPYQSHTLTISLSNGTGLFTNPKGLTNITLIDADGLITGNFINFSNTNAICDLSGVIFNYNPSPSSPSSIINFTVGDATLNMTNCFYNQKTPNGAALINNNAATLALNLINSNLAPANTADTGFITGSGTTNVLIDSTSTIPFATQASTINFVNVSIPVFGGPLINERYFLQSYGYFNFLSTHSYPSTLGTPTYFNVQNFSGESTTEHSSSGGLQVFGAASRQHPNNIVSMQNISNFGGTGISLNNVLVECTFQITVDANGGNFTSHLYNATSNVGVDPTNGGLGVALINFPSSYVSPSSSYTPSISLPSIISDPGYPKPSDATLRYITLLGQWVLNSVPPQPFTILPLISSDANPFIITSGSILIRCMKFL